MNWFDLAVQGTLKSLLHSSKASILCHSAFFMVQLSHPYMTTRKTIALTRRTFVGKVTSLLFNMLSRLVIAFLPRKVKVKVSQSCPTLCDPHGLYRVYNTLGQLKWVAFPFSRGSFQPQGLKPGCPHCRRILYQLNHKGSPRILEWVAYPFSSGSS